MPFCCPPPKKKKRLNVVFLLRWFFADFSDLLFLFVPWHLSLTVRSCVVYLFIFFLVTHAAVFLFVFSRSAQLYLGSVCGSLPRTFLRLMDKNKEVFHAKCSGCRPFFFLFCSSPHLFLFFSSSSPAYN
ncbi:hypothetical protein TRSC58_07428 [Trypanosoma rangeli SC58]|uniref:Transmembrane protein n=1 Tax=Trypanosoma rangeli SC58 TaxID=429131 RepID=A0A061IRZ9_TRYRA|nr:hypothetical protein TRSC58_07428 [Trypanosoma rangeli SC58]